MHNYSLVADKHLSQLIAKLTNSCYRHCCHVLLLWGGMNNSLISDTSYRGKKMTYKSGQRFSSFSLLL